MQRGTNPLSAGQAVVTNQFTGAEFESGAVHRRARAGVNEPQPGVEPEPAGLADEVGGWRGGQQHFSDEGGRRRRLNLKDTPAQKEVTINGKMVSVFKGIAAHPFAYVCQYMYVSARRFHRLVRLHILSYVRVRFSPCLRTSILTTVLNNTAHNSGQNCS
jgi:hypothetical protein